MRLLFCLFAEDIGLLPQHLFTRLVEGTRTRPKEFEARLSQLFTAMAKGGFFGADDIAWFNGGLFADERVIDLTSDDLAVLSRACKLDWAGVEPAIFGTLFERSLDPTKRAQIGAHYTSREDILLIVKPVLMAPLRRRWRDVQQEATALIDKRNASQGRVRSSHQQALQRLLSRFADEIAGVRVLDPACGSGNFLYVALKRLLDLEKEVITFAIDNGMTGFFPRVGPEQLYGIEINAYAHELAQVVVWIGYIQWLHDNGFGMPSSPILKPLQNIQRMDAILDHENGRLVEPPWPEAEFVIGNPPFLGGKLLRNGLGDQYVDHLFALYDSRVPREAELVTYWFERARAQVAVGRTKRVGLLATQGIRGGANRRVLERIKQSGDIFYAQSDRPWILDGAHVRVSMVGFDDSSEDEKLLNEGKDDPAELALENARMVTSINANLTSSIDITKARRLKENLNLAYMGDTKGGPFDIPGNVAEKMLESPLNPNGRPNSDVVRPWVNGMDVTRRPRGMWIVDFGEDMPETQAMLHETPYAYVEQRVKPVRISNNRPAYRQRWWLHVEPRSGMRSALRSLNRFIAVTRHSKHLLFVWLIHPTLPDSALIAIARADDYFFGILHSRVHEVWVRATGTQLREFASGFRYTPTTTFETFPFPWPPGTEPIKDQRVEAVTKAACELVRLRDAWLNPVGTSPARLEERTLTKLYNEHPAWLAQAHRTLDSAVLDAYGWPHHLGDPELLDRLLALNLRRAAA